MGSITIVLDVAGSPRVILSKEKALELLSEIAKARGHTRDLEEAMRIVRNFDEFYRISKKRFEEYLFPPKDARDALSGKVVVQKLRLIKNGGDLVEIFFDKRVNPADVANFLKRVGYEVVEVRREY